MWPFNNPMRHGHWYLPAHQTQGPWAFQKCCHWADSGGSKWWGIFQHSSECQAGRDLQALQKVDQRWRSEGCSKDQSRLWGWSADKASTIVMSMTATSATCSGCTRYWCNEGSSKIKPIWIFCYNVELLLTAKKPLKVASICTIFAKKPIYSSIAQSVERRTVNSAAITKPPNLVLKSHFKSMTYN